MTDEQHIAAGHIRVVSGDSMCFWAVPPDLAPYSCGGFDPWAHTDPLKCKTMSLAEWQYVRANDWKGKQVSTCRAIVQTAESNCKTTACLAGASPQTVSFAVT